MLKKILNIFFTILLFMSVFIFCSNKYWLIPKPVNLTFFAKSSGNYFIKVFINNYYDKSTKKERKYIIKNNYKLGYTYIADIVIPDKIQYLKFNFEINASPSQDDFISIESIYLKGFKFTEKTLKNFEAENAELYINGSKLILKPVSNNFSLIYKDKLNINPDLQFKNKRFICLCILYFFISLGLALNINYNGNFRKKSKADILFLIIFFLLLLVPAYNINKNAFSYEEGRILQKWYPIYQKDEGFNYLFGKDFEKWFNDRFFLRINLIHLVNGFIEKISCRYANYPKGFIDKIQKRSYQKDEFYYYPNNLVEKEFKVFELIKRFCEKNNIKLYVLIVPSPAEIYKTDSIEISDSGIIQTIDYLEKEKNIHIVYPKESLIEASKTDTVFFKTEHHWTDYGAYVGYRDLINVIKKDFPYINAVNEENYDSYYNKLIRAEFNRNFDLGKNCKVFGISNSLCEKYHDVEYKYFKNKDIENLEYTVEDKPFEKYKKYYYPKGADLRVVLYGTSQSENLCGFIPYTFKHVLRIRSNGVIKIKKKEEFKMLKYYRSQILDFKPDILILCFSFADIENLHDLINME